MFSIVIPLFNKAHTIENTLKSVFSQTYAEFELLVVNDGSTDNGLEVIRSFTTDSRLRIIDQENQGVSAARNIGVTCARYEYIAFLDGDDKWLPEYLAKMKKAIELFPDAGMYCCAGMVTAPGYEVSRIAKKYIDKIVKIDFFENPHVFLHTSATVVSKKEFCKTQGFPVGMKRNQDFALFFSLALITPVVYCGFPLTIYVGGVEGQATNTPVEKVLEHVINRFNIVFDNWVKTKCRSRTFEIFIKYELRHMFITHLRNKDYRSNQFLIDHLSFPLLKLFPTFEIQMYRKRILRQIGMLYLMMTKLRWRLRGYPRINY